MKIVYRTILLQLKIIITTFRGHTGQFSPNFAQEVEIDRTAKQKYNFINSKGKLLYDKVSEAKLKLMKLTVTNRYLLAYL
jgi:hypothetical protein